MKIYVVATDWEGEGAVDYCRSFRFHTLAGAQEWARGHSYLGRLATVRAQEVSLQLARRLGFDGGAA